MPPTLVKRRKSRFFFSLSPIIQKKGEKLSFPLLPPPIEGLPPHYSTKQKEVYQNPSGGKIIDVSIIDEWYQDFPKAYQYAMDMTEKEIHQAVEGLYHNLK